MSTTPAWVTQFDRKIRKAIDGIDDSLVSDIYALSFWKGGEDDDDRKPTIAVGYNTLSRWEEMKSKASDDAEAKWNFAFWLQNELVLLGGGDPELQEWIKSLPCYFPDEEMFSGQWEDKCDQLRNRFLELFLPILQQLHTDGTITRKFGRDIPTIVHELEYYEDPLNWTKTANPNGQADEFVQWVEAMYESSMVE